MSRTAPTFYYDTSYPDPWQTNLAFGHTFMDNWRLWPWPCGLSFSYLDDNNGYAEFRDGLLSVSMSFPAGENIAECYEMLY